MAIENAAVLVVLGLLGVVVVLAVLLLRRRTDGAPALDGAAVLLQRQLTDLAEQVTRLAAEVPQRVGTSLTPLLGQVQQGLADTTRSLQKASADTGRLIADVSHRLGELGQSSQQILALGQDVRNLQQIFQAPKIRGGLGETALGSMLEQIFPAGHFSLQHPFRDGEIVDAVLRLPGGLVPIDSKFPLAGFRALLEAGSDEQRERARREFARAVRKHVEDIGAKYIRPAEGTLDFALMYVPAENVFYEMIVGEGPAAAEETIAAAALRRRVIPVSPNTLYAYLQAIAYGLMGLKIEARAREILNGLRQLHGDFDLYRQAFDLGGKHLRNAQTAFAEAGDRAGRIGIQLEQFARVAEEAPAGGRAGALEVAREVPVSGGARSESGRPGPGGPR
jgi:DNA recombination protein RmuC